MESTSRIGARNDGLDPAAQTPQNQMTESLASSLEVVVAFTDERTSLDALRAAASLAADLDAGVLLVVPQVVSHALPLDEPAVPIHFIEQRIKPLVSNLGVDTTIDICLCRSKKEGLLHALKPHSLIVVGGRRRWWPTPEKALVRKLRQAGHEVIFTETE